MRGEDKVQLLENGARAAKVSTWVTAALTVIKASVGLLSGSIALSADAVHSLSDLFTSIAVWLGLRLSRRGPSEMFPYGFYRVETLAFLTVSIVVAVSGAQILLESFKRILNPSALALPTVTLSVAAVSASVSYFLSRYKSRVAKETNSQALEGEAKHSMVDVLSSALVFAGIAVHYVGFHWAEALAGVMIGLLIIKLGLGMGKDAVLVLLDACLKPELVSRMRKIATEIDGVNGVHDVKVRKSGPFIFAEMHVEVDSAMPVDKAAWITNAIEERVRDSIKELDSMMLHIEPSKKDVYRIAAPVERDDGLDSKVCGHFGKSPYFMFIDLRMGNPTSSFVIENPAAKADRKRGIEAAHILVRHKADVLVAKEIGEGPYHVLRDSSIQILDLNGRSEIKHVLDAFSRKKLRSFDPAKHASRDANSQP